MVPNLASSKQRPGMKLMKDHKKAGKMHSSLIACPSVVGHKKSKIAKRREDQPEYSVK
jgi:hypothetical protein